MNVVKGDQYHKVSRGGRINKSFFERKMKNKFVVTGMISDSRSHTTPCSTPSNLTSNESCIILAISEGRGAARGEVGMAAIDLRRPRLVLCQLSDSHSYLHSLTKVHFFKPVEIIVPNTFNSGPVPTELFRLVRDQFPQITLTSVQRKHFSDTAGLQQIKELCLPEYSSVQLQLMHKFYALTAAAAVLKYVEFIQCVVFAQHSLKIEYHGSQNSTVIDVETAIRLELVESLSGSTEFHHGCCLLAILNHASTAGGVRTLQPPCGVSTISFTKAFITISSDVETAIRLELVESLSGSTEFHHGCCLLAILNHASTAGGVRTLQPPCGVSTISFTKAFITISSDVETAIRLELVESLSGSTEFHHGCCLLAILNHASTVGGVRTLRANILQPTCDVTTINTRLESVEELLENDQGLMAGLQNVMRQLSDVEKVLLLCVKLPQQDGGRAGEAQLSHTLQLKATMELLPALITALQPATGLWFSDVKKDLENPKYAEILSRIKRVLQDGVTASRGGSSHMQRCFAVRPEINGLLDVARRSYSELITDIQETVNQLSQQYGLPLKTSNSASKGFHIVLPVKKKGTFDVSTLPPIFFQVQNLGTSITMTTEEIVLLDQRARESLTEILTMSNTVIVSLLTELRPYMGVLYQLCEHVAELDVLLSLAQVSSSGGYVRPQFNEFLELKDATHPMLEYVISSSVVPNDVFASPEYNFNIITGPNMGGKTIFIKQIALLQIMAQIGCFVPASSATFRITDHIFSRIGFNDSIECNSSTYVLEMKEMHYILQTITPTSLVIIDELCRGTSSEEGTSMAWAICESLLDTKAFTFFTTHFLYLTKLQDLYCSVVNFHMDAEQGDQESGRKLTYKYKLRPGVTSIERYGLTLAHSTNLPPSLLALADDLATVLIKYKKPFPADKKQDPHDFYLYKLSADLKQKCRIKETKDEDLQAIVDAFKSQHPDIMQKIMSSHSSQVPNLSSNNTSDKDESFVDTNKKGIKNLDASKENPLGSILMGSKCDISSSSVPKSVETPVVVVRVKRNSQNFVVNESVLDETCNGMQRNIDGSFNYDEVNLNQKKSKIDQYLSNSQNDDEFTKFFMQKHCNAVDKKNMFWSDPGDANGIRETNKGVNDFDGDDDLQRHITKQLTEMFGDVEIDDDNDSPKGNEANNKLGSQGLGKSDLECQGSSRNVFDETSTSHTSTPTLRKNVADDCESSDDEDDYELTDFEDFIEQVAKSLD